MANRKFLLLQGPHGPFFTQLSRHLRGAGAATIRVGFNGGDALFSLGKSAYVPYRGTTENWGQACARLIGDHNVTDLVFYGEGRPLHDIAADIARARGLTTHIFEEGYLRPYWITYEREGSNGRSPLCRIPLSVMRSDLPAADAPESAAGWGELKEHIFYGAAYHAALTLGRPFYRGYRGHRDISVLREAALNIGRFFALPLHSLERRAATARIRMGGYPYHLVLLQLEHDASFRGHGGFSSMGSFARTVIEGFAKGGRPHHHLVFKAHPLDDGRGGVRDAIRLHAKDLGLSDRVHFLWGAKLAGLLDDAVSAVTINSTAGQQVLRRGIPLRAMGQAVYTGRGFTSEQPLEEFFANPGPPDLEAYRVFRRFQLETCQVPGGYYAARGRRRLLRRVVDLMLSSRGPYARLQSVADESRHLRVVAR